MNRPEGPLTVFGIVLEVAAICPAARDVFEPHELEERLAGKREFIRQDGPPDAEWYQVLFNGRKARGGKRKGR